MKKYIVMALLISVLVFGILAEAAPNKYSNSSAKPLKVNNKKYSPVSPDLVVSIDKFMNRNAEQPPTTDVSVLVKNQGATSTGQGFDIEIRFVDTNTNQGTNSCYIPVNTLAPSAYGNVSCNAGNVKAGTYSVLANADYKNVIAESNENNNLDTEKFVQG